MSAGALKDFQRRVAAAVMAPLTRRETMSRRRRDGLDPQAEAAGLVTPNDRLSAFERLEIYNRQYWFRVLSSLADDFPGLRAVLGRARFGRMTRAYLVQCPSTSFTLRNLGARLESWLRDHPAWAQPRAALALDMVRLEWAHIEAYDLTDRPAQPAALAAVGEDTRLALQPHVRLVAARYPVDELLLAVRREERAGALAEDRGAVLRLGHLARRMAALPPRPVYLAVHRHDLSVYYKRLDPEAYRILAAIQSGATLGAALEAGFADSPMAEADRPAYLHQAFQEWARFGWFTRPSHDQRGCDA